MLTDVEIAQSAKMKPIKEIAQKVGLDEDDLELYGKYKAKISLEAITKLKNNENGKLILVTAINPTPAGEGKTTTMIGLSQALNKLGKKSVVAMREPSSCASVSTPSTTISSPSWSAICVTLGPCFWCESKCLNLISINDIMQLSYTTGGSGINHREYNMKESTVWAKVWMSRLFFFANFK